MAIAEARGYQSYSFQSRRTHSNHSLYGLCVITCESSACGVTSSPVATKIRCADITIFIRLSDDTYLQWCRRMSLQNILKLKSPVYFYHVHACKKVLQLNRLSIHDNFTMLYAFICSEILQVAFALSLSTNFHNLPSSKNGHLLAAGDCQDDDMGSLSGYSLVKWFYIFLKYLCRQHWSGNLFNFWMWKTRIDILNPPIEIYDCWTMGIIALLWITNPY